MRPRLRFRWLLPTMDAVVGNPCDLQRRSGAAPDRVGRFMPGAAPTEVGGTLSPGSSVASP